MKIEQDKNSDFLAQWVKDAGTESPSKDFSQKVMAKISLLPQSKYQPVISPLGWKLILGYILTIALVSFFLSPSENSANILWTKIPFYKLPSLSLDISNFIIPQSSMNAQMLIGLFTFLGMGIISWWLNFKHSNLET